MQTVTVARNGDTLLQDLLVEDVLGKVGQACALVVCEGTGRVTNEPYRGQPGRGCRPICS